MQHKRRWLSLVVGIGLGLMASGVIAEGESERARVVHDTRAVHKTDEDGQVRAVLLAQGNNAFMGKFILQPNAQIAPRRNTTEEYIYVIEGSSVITINGQSYIVGPNMAVYIPADGEVSFINGSEPLVAIQVFAGPEPAAQYQDWKTRDATQSNTPRKRAPKTRVRQSSIQNLELAR
ncbi:MAG: cupin domain-containing protein [Bradymonadaceae bacterium]|nr:cupin domain-containing protein [Lujinxingiaceae bacterium]